MAEKNTAAFGIYPSVGQAERAVDTLVNERFSNDEISVLIPDNQNSRDFAEEAGTTGVAAGGTIGGAFGLLAGGGALAIPGVGPIVAAGPIIGQLARLGVGGAAGGLVGALVGMGIPQHQAKRYQGRINEGGVLLSVRCDTSEEIARAKGILKRTGAANIASAGDEAVPHTQQRDPHV